MGFAWQPQGNPAPLAFHLLNLHFNYIPNLQAGTGGKLAAVQQAILLDANIHEGAKINYVAHGAFEAHPGVLATTTIINNTNNNVVQNNHNPTSTMSQKQLTNAVGGQKSNSKPKPEVAK